MLSSDAYMRLLVFAANLFSHKQLSLVHRRRANDLYWQDERGDPDFQALSARHCAVVAFKTWHRQTPPFPHFTASVESAVSCLDSCCLANKSTLSRCARRLVHQSHIILRPLRAAALDASGVERDLDDSRLRVCHWAAILAYASMLNKQE